MDYGFGMSVFKNNDFIKAPGMLEIGNTLARMENQEIQSLNNIATISAIENKSGRSIQEISKDAVEENKILQEAATRAVKFPVSCPTLFTPLFC